jgi:hypothetical protein
MENTLDVMLRTNLVMKDGHGNTIIHKLCRDANYYMFELLYKYIDDENINIMNNEGNTPIHLFINNYNMYDTDHKILLDLILRKKPNLNCANIHGQYMLETAITNDGDEYFLRKLIENGASIDCLMENGKINKKYKKLKSFRKIYREIKEENSHKCKEEYEKLKKDYELLKQQYEKQSNKINNLKKIII